MSLDHWTTGLVVPRLTDSVRPQSVSGSLSLNMSGSLCLSSLLSPPQVSPVSVSVSFQELLEIVQSSDIIMAVIRNYHSQSTKAAQ